MRLSHFSLTIRLIFAASMVLMIMMILTALALDKAFKESATTAQRERLLGQVYMLMAAADISEKGNVYMPIQLAEARLSSPDSGLYGVVSKENEILWKSPSSLNITLPAIDTPAAGVHKFSYVKTDKEHYFILNYGVRWQIGTTFYPLIFTIIENLQGFQQQLQNYRHNLWGWLALMVIMLLILQFMVLVWGLQPLKKLEVELIAIEKGEKQYLEDTYPKELQRVTDNLNILLHHEKARQQRYQNALADLTHSLKTPLAVLRSLMYTNQKSQLSTEIATVITEQVVCMDRIVEYQLQRAATKGALGIKAAIPVLPIINKIIDSLDKVYSEKGVIFHYQGIDEPMFKGDEGDLLELLGNTLDNAYKWCQHSVYLTISMQQGKYCMMIEDDGIGISEDNIDSIFQRGARIDQSVPGHGIGLSIIRDILDVYQATLSIKQSTKGGACFIMQFSS